MSSVLLLFPTFTACGDDGSASAIDAGDVADGGPPPIDGTPGIDAIPAECFVQSSFGNLGTIPSNEITASGSFSNPMARSVQLETTLAGDATSGDVLHIEIYEGSGGAPVGIGPGTYVLMDDDLQYRTCGICIYLEADRTAGGRATLYFVESGTLIIDQMPTMSGGTFAGSLDDVVLEDVALTGEGTSVPRNNGCEATITSASFSVTVP